jgi:hypothetical protein
MQVSDYLALVTTEHSDRPKYMASVAVGLDQLTGAVVLLDSIAAAFDIDDAAGVQLDTIGEWVGRSRQVSTPITGVYFAWADTALTGWASGVWKGQFDPVTGLTALPDDSYRILLKAKIAANRWDGSIPGAYAVWSEAFGTDSTIIIQDNQDMSMTVGVVGLTISAVTRALIRDGYISLKPAGVRVNYVVSPDTGPLFAWGVPNGPTLAGWVTGRWGTAL